MIRTLDTHEQKLDFLVSSAENLSRIIFDKYFKKHHTFIPLDVFDIISKYWKLLIEIKIKNDIKDIARYLDEVTRSNQAKYYDYHRMVIWIEPNPTVKIFKWAFGICQKANVLFHHVYWIEPQPKEIPFYTSNFVYKLRKILNEGPMKPLQKHKRPSKKLSLLAQMLACFPGLSEEKAIECANTLHEWSGGKYGEEMLNSFWEWRLHIIELIGLKKDGTPRKLAHQLINWLETGEEP